MRLSVWERDGDIKLRLLLDGVLIFEDCKLIQSVSLYGILPPKNFTMRASIFYALTSQLVAGSLTPGTLPQWNIQAGIAIYSCTQEGTIALTFDDGPFVYTESVLDQLAAAGFSATFFLNGKNWGNIADYQSTVNRMVDDGHQVASHTYV